jgi:hypothetical protein
MGAAKRQQKYKAAETKAVKATSDMLQSRLSKQRSVGSGNTPELSERHAKATVASKKADAVKASLKAPSTKMKKVK